ncbi:MAG: imelysin family protein [Bdellovibrio sp.]|jgi:predicted lipoprotein
MNSLNYKQLPLLFLTLALVACSDFTNNNKPEANNPPAPGTPAGPQKPLPPELQKPNEGEFTKEKMLYNMGLLLTQKVKEYQVEAQVFALGLDGACENLTDAKWMELQNKYKAALLRFQALLAAPIGPLEDNGNFLIDNIYAWPIVNYCGIDREVLQSPTERTPAARLLHTIKGLSALEYLLFEKSLVSVCNSRAYPETKIWSEKPVLEKRQSRCTMAAGLAKDLEDKTALLWKAWNPAEGHFAKALVDGSRYKTAQASLNDFSDHLFRIEVIKDSKLGKPLGRHKDCLSASCPEQAELRYSDLSFAAIKENLSMLQILFWGAKSRDELGFGLDDGLKKLGRSDVADRLHDAIDRAVKQSTQMQNESMQTILATLDANECAKTTWDSRLVPACALFQDIRQVSILMKSEFLSVFDLRPPKTIEGDND